MDTVPVPGTRSTWTQGPYGPRLEIPARRNAFVSIFLGVWLVGWAVGEVAVLRQLQTVSGAPAIFLTVWMIGWTIGGLLATGAWLWMIGGREHVELRSGQLVQRFVLFGLSRSRAYDIGHVKNVRVSPEILTASSMNTAWRSWSFVGGMIAFDYGAKTIRIAGSIEEAEAATIVRRIEERYRIGSSSRDS